MLACQNEQKPKPRGLLALNFPEQDYKPLKSPCPYSFDVNKITSIQPSRSKAPCELDIEYPEMEGTIYISYEPIDSNLEKLLKDAQNLPLKHSIKADEIYGDEYADSEQNTYGVLYTVTGDAASQAQFYLTDSTEHFMTGSIYFQKAPNYDSIYPAAEYLKSDMRRLMESLQWEE